MNNPTDHAPAGSSPITLAAARRPARPSFGTAVGARLPDFNPANRKTLMMGGILVANGKLRQDRSIWCSTSSG